MGPDLCVPSVQFGICIAWYLRHCLIRHLFWKPTHISTSVMRVKTTRLWSKSYKRIQIQYHVNFRSGIIYSRYVCRMYTLWMWDIVSGYSPKNQTSHPSFRLPVYSGFSGLQDIHSLIPHPVASEHRWLVKAPRWIHSVPDVSGRRSWRCGCQARL